MSNLLWLTLPYIALTSFVVGHVWRYRKDQFGWTTRSSQMYESRLLRLGSPLFHFGILAVLAGHVGGVLIPASWTSALGISEGAYHVIAVGMGVPAGIATVAGLAILVYRRTTVVSVRKVTTVNDKIMYGLFIVVIATGMFNTLGENVILGHYDYRSTVSPWFRSLFSLSPQPELMVGVPLSFQLHGLTVLALLAIWPYTRLVHVFSAPLGYLGRPYVVYRSKDVKRPGGNRYDRAWETANRTRA
ncbi:nitrate reductase (gamma subunit) [Rhodococcus sp. RD6.2]|uniref:respiratory nitrate reductase subunit gamma n=1 Tax=Rhodococcus sp. RD6.2 TaxID=260936 RepID=UPI00063BBAFA|nr:respiratory nitrate reductase subunit gamma [Rhodococcus sp. RD6.2]CRK51043.1 nitrate reductase (gamma subunit) [Rhodococcus sp. RD6.2]